MRLFVILCAVAALLPLVDPGHRSADADAPFPGWPTEFAGRPLRAEPLSRAEEKVLADFPGKVARFHDGEKEIIMRWVLAPTRQLHPVSDCFAALGYELEPKELWRDPQGKVWNQFIAHHGATRLLVREIIQDEHGQNWSDVSAWWWASVLGPTEGPWWALTVATRSSAEAEGMP